MKNTKFYTLLVIFLFVISGPANSDIHSVNGQEADNFELLLIVQAGNRLMESYAFFIKDALSSIYIDVEILAPPFGQFVNQLFHSNFFGAQSFDLALFNFENKGLYPSFKWQYHSNSSIGHDVYQLNNDDWQAFMESDIGVSTDQVNELLDLIEYELDPIIKLNYLNEFSELYMSQLLYDFPLTTQSTTYSVWKGFGGENNEILNFDEGLWKSSWLGAYWEDNPQERIENNVDSNSLQLRITGPINPGNFDPYQAFDYNSRTQTDYLTLGLLNFDHRQNPHPGIAYQWFTQEVKYNISNEFGVVSDLIDAIEHRYILDTSWQFPETTDYEGNSIPAKSLDANDFALVLEMLKNPHTNVNNKEEFSSVVGWNVSSTIEVNDTLSLYLKKNRTTMNDLFSLATLTPIPSHILGGDLNIDDPLETGLQPNGTTISLRNTNFSEVLINPQTTIEWLHWGSEEGHSLIGPMQLAEFALVSGGGSIFYDERGDFRFPNEWDTTKKYLENISTFDSLYATLNVSTWKMANLDTGENVNSPVPNLKYFAPHLGGKVQALYFSFADDPSTNTTREKPTSLSIDRIILKNIEDDNTALLSFENGGLDSYESSILGENVVSDHIEDPKFNSVGVISNTSPYLLMFNLLNEHLQKRNVRYAIASAIDRDEMANINGGWASPHHSPVWSISDTTQPSEFISAGINGENLKWYNPFPIEYDFEIARDLIRLEYGDPRINPEPPVDPTTPITISPTQPSQTSRDEDAAPVEVGSTTFISIMTFSIIPILILRRKKI